MRLEEVYRCAEQNSKKSGIAMRALVMDWYSGLRKCLGLSIKCVELAMIYFDKVVSKTHVGRSKLYNLALVCLFVAIKFTETKTVSLQDLCSHSGTSGPDLDKIYRLEVEVLQILEWKLNYPTVTEYLTLFYLNIGSEDKIKEKLYALGEMAVTNCWTLDFLPSTVAAAILLIACDESQMEIFRCILLDVEMDTELLEDIVGFALERFQLDLPKQQPRKRVQKKDSDPLDTNHCKRKRSVHSDVLLSTSPCSVHEDGSSPS
uniref:Cyclin-like domain-containing protein n=1 Tax=Rhodosorus marinus TaxID=101924 RepID=A0A7S0BT62_9RHOD